jgi:hypothetical protein
VPQVASFAGIIIWLYSAEHGIPHVHVQYGEHWGVVALDSLALLEGYVPAKKLAAACEWIGDNRAMLHATWIARNS